MSDLCALMHPYFDHLERAVLAIAAERNDALIQHIFQGERWHLTLVEGAVQAGHDPFKAIPDHRQIEVSCSGLAMLWCVAAYGALTFDLVRGAKDLPGGLIDVGPLFRGAEWMLALAEQLRTVDMNWPADRYRPNVDDLEEPFQTITRLFYGAVSWILLHEIAHVYYRHRTDLVPAEMVRQERDADQFATRWLFDYPPSPENREFRILSVGIAVAWLLLFEPVGGDPNHPPIVSRLVDISECMNPDRQSVALEVFAHLLKILFFPGRNAPEFKDSVSLFEWTRNLFRQ
jgi:hypothetical protein